MNRIVSRLPTAAAITALLVVVVTLYFPTWDAPFEYDDVVSLKTNPHIQQLWPLSAPLTAPPESPLAGRPIPSLSFALNYAASGFNLRPWHAVNTLLHAANAVLLMLLLCRLQKTMHIYAESSQNPGLKPSACFSGFTLAFAAALLWAVHPLNSEAVIYLLQRTEMLVTFFYLATLYAALRGINSSNPAASRRWFIASIIACIAGMASKEVMVSAPIAVLLMDATLAARDSQSSFIRRAFNAINTRRGYYASLAASWLLLAALVASAPRGVSAGFGRGIGAMEYLFTQAGVIVHYLRLCFWPTPLVMFHDWPLATGIADVWWQFALLAALFIACIVGLWRGRLWGVGGLIAFMVLAPSSSFVPVVTEVVAERRMYLPSAVVIAILIIGLARMWDALGTRLAVKGKTWAQRWPRACVGALAGALVVAAVFSVMTNDRGRDWASTEVFWRQNWAWYPDHPLIVNAVGITVRANGRTPEAAGYFLRSSINVQSKRWRMYQRFTEPMENLAQFFIAQNRPDLAIPWLTTAADLRQYHPQIFHALGLAQAAAAKNPDAINTAAATLAHAIELVDQVRVKTGVTRATPQETSTWRTQRANLLLKLARPEDAWRELETALREDPANWRALALRARMQGAQGWFDQAAESYRKAIALNPDAEWLRKEFETMQAEAARAPH